MRIYKSLKNDTLVARIFACLIVSLTAVATPVLAHDTFLLPAKNIWRVGHSVDIGLASTLSFPDLTWGVTQDRISSTFIRVGGEAVTTFTLTDGKAFLNVGFQAERSGFGVVALSTKPRFGDIAPEKAEGYFDEIGAAPSVRQAFAALAGEPPLHRSYSKHSKTFICVEDCAAGSATGSTPVAQSSTFIRVGGEAVTTFTLTDGKAFLNVGFQAERSGFGVVALSTKPRFGDIAPEKAEGYFDEIGAAPSVRQAFAALAGEPPLHRSYSKHSKTFICVEDCAAGSATGSTPVGQALEFIAVDGGANVFQLLSGGKPLAHHKVKVTTSAKEVHEITTTMRGELTMSGKISGVIMLRAVVITLPDQADGIYHSDYATLVVDITRAP